MKHQKNGDLLSMEEVAKMLGLSNDSIRQYATSGRLKTARKQGKDLFFAREEVEVYAKRRRPYPFKTKVGEREARREVAMQTVQQVAETGHRDDAHLLQTVLSTALSFLSTHRLSIAIASLKEVEATTMRLWEITTPQCMLRVVAEGNDISVLSDAYQRQQEQAIATLKDQLREAQTKLKYLRDKPRKETLNEYAQDLDVWIDAREEGFFVYCKEFPFASCESTEDEALAAFRRMLWAYRAWLQYHERSLTPKMQEDYIKLDDLLVERPR